MDQKGSECGALPLSEYWSRLYPMGEFFGVMDLRVTSATLQPPQPPHLMRLLSRGGRRGPGPAGRAAPRSGARCARARPRARPKARASVRLRMWL